MLLHLLRAAVPRRRAWLVEFLAAPEPERTDADVERVRDWMEQYGSLEFARAYGDRLAEAADAAFEEAFADVPPSPHVRVHPRAGALHARAHGVNLLAEVFRGGVGRVLGVRGVLTRVGVALDPRDRVLDDRLDALVDDDQRSQHLDR